MLGIQATVGTAWWLATFLLYIKNTANDNDLTALNGGTIFPIGWFWERIAEANGQYNYFAMGLASNFIFYGLVSTVEFIAWMFYLNGDPYFAAFWFSTIGYYASILGLPLPWIFCAVHIRETMDGVTNVFPGTWAIFILIVTLVFWIVIMGLHINYVPQFLVHVASLPTPPCFCTLPKVEPLPENASQALQAENARATAERDYLCSKQCPAKGEDGSCPLVKEEGQSDADYEKACADLNENIVDNKAAAAVAAAASLADEDAEEDVDAEEDAEVEEDESEKEAAW